MNTILLNFDIDYEKFFLDSLDGDLTDVERKAVEYLDRIYKDKGIGDIFFNIFCQSSLTPSKVFISRAEKYHQKKENGIDVNYEDHPYLRASKILTEDCGVSVTSIWIEHCKKIGINPWLSFRMNDHHCQNEKTNFLRSDFFYEAEKNGWLLGKTYRSSYNDFDYGVPEVREKMLEYIKEQLSAFDVYGIELDFMREPKCVKFYDDERACEYMNEFMAETKRVVGECEALHGHEIKIAARLPRDIDTCKMIGFDACYWAAHGFVDAVIPSSHWSGVDTGMPIAKWCEELSPYGVEVYACMEMNLPNKLYIDTEVAKAFTAEYHAEGSKRTYVYNLYHPYLSYINDLDMWAVPAPTAQELAELWSTCGDVEKCQRGVRRHILTEESPAFDDLKPHWKPLPATVGEAIEFEVGTGYISPDAELTLFIGINNATREDIKVTLNEVPCEYIAHNAEAHILKNAEISSENIFAFKASSVKFGEISQSVSVKANEAAEIFYLELMVDSK